MKKENHWYTEALHDAIVYYEFEVDTIKAEIAYLERAVNPPATSR